MKERLLETRCQTLADTKLRRLHMPGHKGRTNHNIDFMALDYTEIEGTDNLHHPVEVIAEVQEKIAALYGSEESHLLVGGTTAGILAAVMGTCQEKEQLIVPLNSHKSVYSALMFGRINPVFIQPVIKQALGVFITKEAVLDCLEANPEVKGMILVNPTYYGSMSDTRAIAKVLHQKGKFLIVDEAHGAHLKFCKCLPEDAVTAGADLVIQSTHKILSALTQSAILHRQGNRVDATKVARLLTMLQSSSPSYPLMMSIENAIDEAAGQANEQFEKIDQKWHCFFINQDQTANITLVRLTADYDTSKWLFHVKSGNGPTIAKRLRQEAGLVFEFAEKDYVLAMTGMGTTMTDLECLIEGIYQENKRAYQPISRVQETKSVLPKLYYSMDKAFFKSSKKRCLLEKAVGKIAGDFVIPYPPGIPILVPGAQIELEQVKQIQRSQIAGEIVLGLKDNRIEIVE